MLLVLSAAFALHFLSWRVFVIYGVERKPSSGEHLEQSLHIMRLQANHMILLSILWGLLRGIPITRGRIFGKASLRIRIMQKIHAIIYYPNSCYNNSKV